ncbi:MAG: hypothetical protein WA705_20275 [Candidatus Ozemobacteraceae bacterium]
MNQVKKSISLMLVFLFTICFVPAFAEDYRGNGCPKPSENLAVLEAKLQSVMDNLFIIAKTNDDNKKSAALDMAVRTLKQISMPKKCKPLLADIIGSLEEAKLYVSYEDWEKEGRLNYYKGGVGFRLLCRVLLGKTLG